MYEIYTTEEFGKDYEKLDYSIQKQVEKIFEKLKVNPYVGKPLGMTFLEKRKFKIIVYTI